MVGAVVPTRIPPNVTVSWREVEDGSNTRAAETDVHRDSGAGLQRQGAGCGADGCGVKGHPDVAGSAASQWERRSRTGRRASVQLELAANVDGSDGR